MFRIGEEEKAAVARVIDSKCLFKKRFDDEMISLLEELK